MKYGAGCSFSWLVSLRFGKTIRKLVSEGRGSSLWQGDVHEFLCVRGVVKMLIVSITTKSTANNCCVLLLSVISGRWLGWMQLFILFLLPV